MKKPVVKYLRHYQPPFFLVDRIHLDVDLHDDHALVRSRMEVKENPDHPTENKHFDLDGKDLELVSIELDGQPLSDWEYTLHDEGMRIAEVPHHFVLEIVTRIKPRENTSLEGLYMSGETFMTQCEAEGFRRITYFPDRPDVMSRYACTITADRTKYPILLSNGNCIKTEYFENNRQKVSWEDPFPKPCYLFALVAGDLACCEDHYNTANGRIVALKFYVDHGDEDKCDHAINSLKKAMAWDEQVFGLSYDLDMYMIVATHAFNAGAMENKGLNIFNSKYVLARPETATDTDFQNIEGVIAHEYFHNWTGNRVTLNSWFQLSLKEGLTVFRDQEFSSDMGSRAIKRISDVRTLRTSQFPEDAGPMAHPIRPESYIEMNNFYTSTIYNKGAEVIRMIQTLLGEKAFRQGMDLYFDRFDGMAVTCEAFIKAMEDAGGMDLTQFRLWYSQAGTPQIRVERHFDKESSCFTLSLTQILGDTPGQTDKKPMLIPVKMALLDQKGKALPLFLKGETDPVPVFEKTISMKHSHETYRFTDIDKEPVPSLFMGFSAPVSLNAGYSLKELMFLMAHDSDDFNRWDASQTLIFETIISLIDQQKKGQPCALDPELIASFDRTLADTRADKALIAQILSAPSESELGDRMERIDVDAIHVAREFFLDSLARHLHSRFLEIFEQNRDTGPYTIDSQSMARRKLKNLALSFLARVEKNSADLLFHEYSLASNMTDSLSALTLLADQDHELKHKALDHFYTTWKKDTLVLDKWFAVQASSLCPGILDSVIRLSGHPDFSMKNPNKIRALIGTFAHGNPFHFHGINGKAYSFIADQVIVLDTINTSVAARLVTAFNKWKRFDLSRQELMKNELERILGTDKLSKAVYEIVSKVLNK
ncbi:MAG: aminopeptidase N [Proteobacteria bacterium]|nr:aminopeptidase N [Pseudomonadota bacterium]